MTTYRIGESGATVFDEDGRPVVSLRPGHVVVEGLLKTPGSLADQHQRGSKRQKGYADKRVRPAEDKSL